MEMNYTISILMIIFGILGLIKIMYDIYKQGKKDILDKMHENGDINNDVYIKYKKKYEI